jgi:hypothetical protein
MQTHSTQLLKLIHDNDCIIVCEPSTPVGTLKNEFISIKTRAGKNVELVMPGGYRQCPVELPRIFLDDFIRANLVQPLRNNEPGSIVYELTKDGHAQAIK